MDFKVLKSFVSAHEAVNWLTQNRIEDTSIETTGTLKSMGMGPVPSGNYHVVLKGRAREMVERLESAETLEDKSDAQSAAQDYFFTDYDQANKMAERLGVRNPFDHYMATPEKQGKDSTSAYGARKKRLNQLADKIGEAYDKSDPLFDRFKSLSEDELVEVITKAVMDVLKGTFVNDEEGGGTSARLEGGSSGVPITQINEEGIRSPSSVTDVNAYFAKHQDPTIREAASHASDPSHPNYKNAKELIDHAQFIEQTTGKTYNHEEHG